MIVDLSKTKLEMKRIFSIVALVLCWWFGVKAQIIYTTETPTTANLNVYVVTTPTIADLIVYKAPNQIYPGVSGNEGIWYFTSIPTIADKTIYFVNTPTIADLKIYYTEIPTEAGWQNESKKHLMQ